MFQDLFGKQPLIVSLDIDDEIDKKVSKLVAAGLSAFELLSYSPNHVAHLRHLYPQIKLGMGNILNVDMLEKAYELQLDFMSTPGFLPSILKTAKVYNMPLLPGVSSLSDAMQTLELGFQHCRPCPGNLELCVSLNQYIPLMKLYPTNIEWESIDQFLDLPSVAAVGLSNPDHLQIIQITESLHI
jgi:2-dehydro-3-deoxyphosphogluconate aldolase/(4S)-4-hydroxy-2-oxoglutarate aldolase